MAFWDWWRDTIANPKDAAWEGWYVNTTCWIFNFQGLRETAGNVLLGALLSSMWIVLRDRFDIELRVQRESYAAVRRHTDTW